MWPVGLHGPSEQTPIKNLGEKFWSIPLLSQERVKLRTSKFCMNRSEQKAIKNFEKGSRGRTQELSKIFRTPTYREHRAVIFAVAQLSCLCITLFLVTFEWRQTTQLNKQNGQKTDRLNYNKCEKTTWLKSLQTVAKIAPVQHKFYI